MAITKLPPNTVYLAGPRTEIGDIAASEAITPGMLVERFASGAVNRVRKSTRTNGPNNLFLLNSPMLNRGIDDQCAAGDLVELLAAAKGTVVYALIASGQNIAFGARVSDAGDGTVKALNTVAIGEALESVNNTAGPGTARIRIEVI